MVINIFQRFIIIAFCLLFAADVSATRIQFDIFGTFIGCFQTNILYLLYTTYIDI